MKSPTGQQQERAEKVLSWLRGQMPDLDYREVDPREEPEYAAKFHIKYAPGLIVDGRIEFVGIPRERMLLDRLRQIQASGGSTRQPEKGGGVQEEAE